MGATNNAPSPSSFKAINLPAGQFYNTGSAAWGIYDDSGLPAYFANKVGIGTTNPGYPLDLGGGALGGISHVIHFSSSNGLGLDFTENSDGSHWLWIHDDGVSSPVEYGAQLYSGGGKVWRIENRTTNKELIHLGTGGNLAVNGDVKSKEVVVTLDGWSDFVFEDGYDLPTLGEVRAHIEEKGHLPGIPSTGEVKRDGVRLGAMDAKLLQKIEELILYAIERSEQVQALQAELERERRQNNAQQTQIDAQKRQLETQRERIDRLERLVRQVTQEKQQ